MVSLPCVPLKGMHGPGQLSSYPTPNQWSGQEIQPKWSCIVHGLPAMCTATRRVWIWPTLVISYTKVMVNKITHSTTLTSMCTIIRLLWSWMTLIIAHTKAMVMKINHSTTLTSMCTYSPSQILSYHTPKRWST